MPRRTRKVYLLHFDPAYEHARHYLGSAADVDQRYQQHVTGQGSPLVHAAVQAGASVTIVRVWEGSFELEKMLKRQHNSPRLCPVCNQRKVNNHVS